MASTMRQIASAIKSALADVDGTGSYTYDLSAAGHVHIGEVLDAPILPFVTVSAVGWDSDTETQLTRYRRRVLFSLYGAVGTSTDTPEARILAAMDLLEDVSRALEADPTLGGLVHTLIVRSAGTFDGLDEQAGQVGAFFGEVDVTYSRTTGV